MRVFTELASGLLAIILLLPAVADAVTEATGLVYHDVNGNGARDAGEEGITDVRVSNGREIVITDENGAYALPVDEDTIIFVIKPRDWMTPVDELNLPKFYYIHKTKGSPELQYRGVEATGPLPESTDFPLTKREEPDTFRVIVFGDTQTGTQTQVGYVAHDVVEEVIGTDAAFGLSLGDLVDNKLELFEPLNRVIAHLGVPFYSIHGNHDTNQDVTDDRLSDETFERVYGPTYYSFDYGTVHFVVLDNVFWQGETEDWPAPWIPGLGRRQLEFLRNDLALVPTEQLIVLTMHVPILQIRMEERKQLYEMLAERPHCVSFSSHTHIQEHYFLDKEGGWPGTKPHHHVNFGTVCGSWWRGEPDELGLPHAMMGCGAPNGYSIVMFDRNRYSIAFKAARRPAGHQMNIYAPEAVSASDAAGTEVLANVFAGSERSTVKMRLDDGDWIQMERVARKDPQLVAIKAWTAISPHLWRAFLPPKPTAGSHVIEVRTTDMFGQTYLGRRIIRVE